MNLGKLDAALSVMLDSKEQEPNHRLSVFVRTEVGSSAAAQFTLKACGDPARQRGVQGRGGSVPSRDSAAMSRVAPVQLYAFDDFVVVPRRHG
jgi:hypothetical protein